MRISQKQVLVFIKLKGKFCFNVSLVWWATDIGQEKEDTAGLTLKTFKDLVFSVALHNQDILLGKKRL